MDRASQADKSGPCYGSRKSQRRRRERRPKQERLSLHAGCRPFITVRYFILHAPPFLIIACTCTSPRISKASGRVHFAIFKVFFLFEIGSRLTAANRNRGKNGNRRHEQTIDRQDNIQPDGRGCQPASKKLQYKKWCIHEQYGPGTSLQSMPGEAMAPARGPGLACWRHWLHRPYMGPSIGLPSKRKQRRHRHTVRPSQMLPSH